MPDLIRLQPLLAALAGWVNRRRAHAIGYLIEEELHEYLNSSSKANDPCGHKKGPAACPISPLDKDCETLLSYDLLGGIRPRTKVAAKAIKVLGIDSPRLCGKRAGTLAWVIELLPRLHEKAARDKFLGENDQAEFGIAIAQVVQKPPT